MMLEILNRVMPLEVPHVQRNNEKLVRHYMAHSKDFPMNQQELAAEIGVDDGYLSSIISPSKDTGGPLRVEMFYDLHQRGCIK